MGVRSSVLHHSERSGRRVLARQPRYDDGLSADDAGGLCARVPEDRRGGGGGGGGARQGPAGGGGGGLGGARSPGRRARRPTPPPPPHGPSTGPRPRRAPNRPKRRAGPAGARS